MSAPSWFSHWRDLSDNILPRRGSFLGPVHRADRGGKLNGKLLDSTAMLAARTLSSGLTAGLTSPAHQWFRLGIGNIEDLTDFQYLHDNELTELPPSLRRLNRLRYLNISENAFEVLPEAVTGMSGLIELRVTDNRLTSLPPSISRLTRLRELHVRNNRLTTLPEAVGSLPELRRIDLRGNPVASLPESLLALPRLEKLDLRWVTTLSLPKWLTDLEDRGCVVYL